jgi:serine/threonine protein kinase
VSTQAKAGRYELREELGRGSMGVVHRAHDPVIGRDVAVKTLHLSETGTGMSREELVSRFQTEARAAGLLNHPNIVVVFDAGEEDGLFYITMELVEGRSLQTLLDGRQLFPLPRVMKLMEQVCSALDFAHQHNVVHRDIKPANLMLTGDDTVKITDFGTAKILQFGTAQTAHVLGTPSYMSPEQVKGKPVDGRSDIFSLGVILYELLTGEKPFPGQNITTVIYKIINEEPIPVQALDSSIHPGLSIVIKRALAKDPAARYKNCNEFLHALKNYHNLTDPNATGRATPKNPPAGTPLVRTPGPSTRPPVSLPSGHDHAAESSALLIPPSTEEAGQGARKQGSFLLSLILLGVIGYAGYRVWPPMLDLWQRVHQDSETPTTPAKTLSESGVPAVNPTTPEAKPELRPDLKSDADSNAVPGTQPNMQPDSAFQAVAPVLKPTPPTQQNPGPIQTLSPESAANLPATLAADRVQGPEKLQSPITPRPASAANLLRVKLQSELAGLSLAGKVNMQVNGNILGFSGQLTPGEHSKLLNLLHNLPAGVRVIDDIEYVDEPEETPGK